MKNRRIKQNIFIIILFVLVAAFVIATSFYNRNLAITGGIGLFIIIIAFLSVRTYWRHSYFTMLSGLTEKLFDKERNALESISLPSLLAYSDGSIVWHNKIFSSEIAEYPEEVSDNLSAYLSKENLADLFKNRYKLVQIKDRFYSVYLSEVDIKNKKAFLLYFFEITELKNKADNFDAIKPAVIIGMYDNFDEMFKSLSDSELSELTSSLDKIVSNWFKKHNSVMRKLSSEKFVVTCHEKDLKNMVDEKFSLLTEVRNFYYCGKPCRATISAGIGRGTTLNECDQIAKDALNLALGRGGDQVAVTPIEKDGEIEFFGGVTSGGERANKIASRVVAYGIKEKILDCENCLIIGHRFPDYDAMGTAIGLHSAVTTLGKDAYIVYDNQNTVCHKLVEKYVNESAKTPFVDKKTAMQKLTSETLVFLVDTHKISICEAPDVVNSAKNVIIIDHHRQSVDYYNKAIISHINPNASSASEMLTELLPYMSDKPLIGNAEADALLSGIMLDTKNFVLCSGVSTFEAASYLKGIGADSLKVKKLFSISAEEQKAKSDIVTSAFVYNDCAIAVADIKNRDGRVISSQSADEMLNISGVKASFVLLKTGDTYNISARSLGEINVQLIMEKLGGGGHHTMSAAQIKAQNSSDALVSLKKAIDNYYDSY